MKNYHHANDEVGKSLQVPLSPSQVLRKGHAVCVSGSLRHRATAPHSPAERTDQWLGFKVDREWSRIRVTALAGQAWNKEMWWPKGFLFHPFLLFFLHSDSFPTCCRMPPAERGAEAREYEASDSKTATWGVAWPSKWGAKALGSKHHQIPWKLDEDLH